MGGARIFDLGAGECGGKTEGLAQKKIDAAERSKARKLKYR